MTYPTYFDKIGLEVINPHSRKTKAGTRPIIYEVVPAGAKGVFSLLYVPFDLIGEPEKKVVRRAIDDLKLMVKAIQKLFLEYGFSAKRTTGWGVAKNVFERDESLLFISKIDHLVKEKSMKKKTQRLCNLKELKNLDISNFGNSGMTKIDFRFNSFEELEDLIGPYKEMLS